jgi:hypothetical protein
MNLNFQTKKIEIFLALFSIFYISFVILAIYSIIIETKNKEVQKFSQKLKSKKIEGESLQNFEDDDEFLFKNEGKNIFFMNGNPVEITKISDAKKACSVESAGKIL